MGALSLNTSSLKSQLKRECSAWKTKYCQNLHRQAKDSLESLTEYMRVRKVGCQPAFGRPTGYKLTLKHVCFSILEGNAARSSWQLRLHAIKKRTKLPCWPISSQVTMGKLKKEVRDLDGLRFMMNMLKEVRQRESGITMEINPIMNMYQVQAGEQECVHPVRHVISMSIGEYGSVG